MAYLSAIKFIDETGVTYGIKQVQNKPRVSSMPYTYDIAEGNIVGHEKITVIGCNTDVDNVTETVWEVGGSYVFPPAGGIQMSIASSSINDSAAGTGIRTVQIDYLDDTYTEQTEIVTLNGFTPVPTVATNILRVNNLFAKTAGTGLSAAGTIILKNNAGTITYSMIAIGNNNQRQVVYTVPAGKTLYITQWQVGIGQAAGNRFGDFALMTNEMGGVVSGLFYYKDQILIQDGAQTRILTMPLKCIAQTDIIASAVSDAGASNAICGAGFQGWIE